MRAHRLPGEQGVRRANWLGELSHSLQGATKIARRLDSQLPGNAEVRALIALLNAATEEVNWLPSSNGPDDEVQIGEAL
jgi:hypothetical protein